MRSCQACGFFKDNTIQGSSYIEGQCRRNAPRPNEQVGTVWPTVSGTDWCGEFRDAVLGQQIIEAQVAAALASHSYGHKPRSSACEIMCSGCGKVSKVEHRQATGLVVLGFHCTCGHYTKAQ